MNAEHFDRLCRITAHRSRRDCIRLIVGTLVPTLGLRSMASAAQLEGTVVLGGACSETSQCRQQDMQSGALCADNGFLADGDFNCCLETGCCQSDADCCAEVRCVPTYDVCNVCMPIPAPTRFVGQLCESDQDCVPYGIFTIRCLDRQCTCVSPADRCDYFQDNINGTPLPDMWGTETALTFAERLSLLEVTGQLDALYDLMHPDAKAVVPREAVIGWYENDAKTFGASMAEPRKVRIIPWTWDVTGRTYDGTAEVAFRQTLADDTVIRDEVHLVQDQDDNWGWFLGRDRAFVEEQIARFTGTPSGDAGAQPQDECRSTEDCSQVEGPSQCVRVLGDEGFMVIICLRDTGGSCGSDDDCLRTMTCNSGTCGSLLAGQQRTTTQDLELHAGPPQRDLPEPGDQHFPPDEVPLLVIPAGSAVTLAPGGSVWGYTEVEYQGTTGWLVEEHLQ